MKVNELKGIFKPISSGGTIFGLAKYNDEIYYAEIDYKGISLICRSDEKKFEKKCVDIDELQDVKLYRVSALHKGLICSVVDIGPDFETFLLFPPRDFSREEERKYGFVDEIDRNAFVKRVRADEVDELCLELVKNKEAIKASLKR